MSNKSIVLFLGIAAISIVSYLVFMSRDNNQITGDAIKFTDAQLKAGSSPYTASVETPAKQTQTPKETSDSEELLAEFENFEVTNETELALSLIEVFGANVSIPMDREAQDRLFAKISATREKEVNAQHQAAVYEPAYDATWPTDIQIKAIEELNNYFPESAAIEKYDCEGSQCALKISFGDDESASYNDAAKFMTSLRSSPSILKSGAKRNVLLSEIGVDDNGKSFVDYVIGNIGDTNGSTEN